MTFNFKEALKTIDIETFAKNFHEKMRQDKQDKIDFWNSDLCNRMIESILKVKEAFDTETFSYFPEKIKNLYSWNDISNENIEQFIRVMADNTLGLPKGHEPQIDNDCTFENYFFVKRGIHVFILSGQGTFIRFTPENSLNDE